MKVVVLKCPICRKCRVLPLPSSNFDEHFIEQRIGLAISEHLDLAHKGTTPYDEQVMWETKVEIELPDDVAVKLKKLGWNKRVCRKLQRYADIIF